MQPGKQHRAWQAWSSSTSLAVLTLAWAVGAADTVGFAEDERSGDLAAPRFGADDWPWWRGPTRDGKAHGSAPERWSRSEGVLWKVAIPGLGHSSPAVVGERIFLTSANEKRQTQSLYCFERATGRFLWERQVNQGGFEHRHEKNTHASSSPACDGERVFAPFLHHGSLHAVALDVDGSSVWQRDLGKFETMHGYSSSPVVWKSSVIFVSDSAAGSFITALHRRTGEELWRTERRAVHSFATPALGQVSGRMQLIINAAETVTSYDPASGRELWLCEGPARIMSCTPALAPELVFASGGYPEKELFCLRGDGTGDVTATHLAWRTKNGLTYVPSPLYHQGRLFVVNDSGVATCFDGSTGDEIWKSRLEGNFSASPILADGRIYVPNEAGKTFVFRAADSFELLAVNDLDDGGFASPTICGGVMYLRTRGHLFALGERQERRVWAEAHAIPKETTSEGSGYFSIVEGKDEKIYVGTAKYRHNAFLVAFDPRSGSMTTVVDAMAEIREAFPDRPDGQATGFAAQAKLHTRNNVGASGKIYVATKQGYPLGDEKRADYPGGYPMVYDPGTGETRVYEIPIAHQGVISITPDESRGVAYISTCSDERPVESAHFMSLDLATGKYRDLLDTRHMYAFIVVDHLGRAYHPILGGEIARYDPGTDRLERLAQTIDGVPPLPQSYLAQAESHPINWDISPDRKTLFAVAMSGNQLYAYDLTGSGPTLAGRGLGPLLAGAAATDCRALCVGPGGVVWAAVTESSSASGHRLHLVSWRFGVAGPYDHGVVTIENPAYTTFEGEDGHAFPWHHGTRTLADGAVAPLYPMGICEAQDGTVYVTVIYPYTVLAVRPAIRQ